MAPAEPSTPPVAVQVSGWKLAADARLDVALEHGAPQVGGELVGDPALLADGGAGVAADRRGGGRIVQALTCGIAVERG